MRTFPASALLLLVSTASAACIIGPADPHPACAEVGVGTSVDVHATVAVALGSTVVDATSCTVVVAPGVKARGFDSVATLECHDDARVVALRATLTFPDFRSAPAGAKIEANAGADLDLTNRQGPSYAGTADDRATITIDSRAGTATGDDVSASYQLRGVLHFVVTKPTLLAPQTQRVTVQPATVEVPFTWTQASFVANTDRCPQ